MQPRIANNSSNYKKITKTVEGESLARDYNIYVFQGTDGDDGDDGREAIPEIQKILSYVNFVLATSRTGQGTCFIPCSYLTGMTCLTGEIIDRQGQSLLLAYGRCGQLYEVIAGKVHWASRGSRYLHIEAGRPH